MQCVTSRSHVNLVLDSRLERPFSVSARQMSMLVMPTLMGRLNAERHLREIATDETTVLCFGNLPPLYRCKGHTLLFLQNRYLTGGLDSSGFSLRVRLRITAERMWLRTRIRNVDEVIVQSPSMATEVEQALSVRARVLPFAPESAVRDSGGSAADSKQAVRFDFLYVASGEPHKNHDRLLEAWKVLAAEGVRPSLCLTVHPERFPDLVSRIRQAAAENELRIENIGQAPGEEILMLYRDARALIYPSLGESLGLPLIEAQAAGLPVIAAERDYVRDVVEPAETFDPMSAVSIARAVRRFLKNPAPVQRILTPEQFLDAICSG